MIINAAARPRTETIAGADQVLIIDDFYTDPYQVREAALKRPFYPQQLYPGALAAVSPGEPGAAKLLDHVRQLFERFFPFNVGIGGVVSDFAVVSRAPSTLMPHMRHPHFDPNYALGLVYLNPFIDAGTSFYRHREMAIHAVRSPLQQRSISEYTTNPLNSRATDGYIKGSTRVWERVHGVAGAFNRFVAYSGAVLHSGDVFLPAGPGLGNCRLTQRFLLVDATPRDRSPE